LLFAATDPDASVADPPKDPATTVAVGQRVRVTSSALKRRVDAIVASFDDTTLTVKAKKGDAQAIPWSTVSALDVQAGYRRPLLQAAAFGGALGAILGLFVHLDKTCGTPEETSDAICSRGEAVGLATLGMGAFSFGCQFLVPADHYDYPKWKAMAPPFHGPVDAHSMTLRLVPARHGVAAQVTLRF
jgi:hypothetical protein